jgi:hypothetical protein
MSRRHQPAKPVICVIDPSEAGLDWSTHRDALRMTVYRIHCTIPLCQATPDYWSYPSHCDKTRFGFYRHALVHPVGFQSKDLRILSSSSINNIDSRYCLSYLMACYSEASSDSKSSKSHRSCPSSPSIASSSPPSLCSSTPNLPSPCVSPNLSTPSTSGNGNTSIAITA